MSTERKATIIAKLEELRDELPVRSMRCEDTLPFRLIGEVREMVEALR